MTSGSDAPVRPAAPGDAAAIAELIRLAFAAQSRRTVPPPSALRETAATVGEHLARGGGAVAERERALVGAVLWEEADGDALYISRLSVHPDHRRRGVARALIGTAEDEGRRRRLGRLTLGVRLTLEDNRRLFRSCGFAETGLHAHDGFAEPTWASMERRLA